MGNCWQRNAMKSNQKIKYHKTRTAKPVKNLAQDNWNLALEYFHAGRFTEAETAIESFLSQNPTHADAWNLSGLIQRGLIQYEKAVEHIETAVRLDTNKCFYLNNLGAIYKDMRQLDKSFQALEKALSIQPDYLEAVYNMGCTLQAKGELIRAGQYYEKALSLKPDYANAQGNLTGIYKDQGEMEEALGACLKTLSLRPSDSYAYSNYIFCLNYLENIPAKDIFEKHLDWNRTFGTESVQPVSSHPNDPKPDRRLRIGYVSPDLNWHSVAFFLLPILQQTDHSGFEIFCYSNSDKTDLATDLMKQASHHWRIIFRQTDEDAAAQILADQIDILIDLAGHSGRNRMTLFAKKPAPVQITYLGYPNTTGCIRITQVCDLDRCRFFCKKRHSIPPGMTRQIDQNVNLIRQNLGCRIFIGLAEYDAPVMTGLLHQIGCQIRFIGIRIAEYFKTGMVCLLQNRQQKKRYGMPVQIRRDITDPQTAIWFRIIRMR